MKKSKREHGVELEKLINAAMLRSSEPYVCRPFMREPREDDVAIGDLSVPMRHLCNLAHEMKEKNDSTPDKTSKEYEKALRWPKPSAQSSAPSFSSLQQGRKSSCAAGLAA